MLIKNLDAHTFTLENFEGPLDFLLHLIQKNEVDIYNIPLQKITEQYTTRLTAAEETCVESGAEFIGLTASLLWLKSKMLLPKHDHEDQLDEHSDAEFSIIHQLIDYCRFKEAAKELTEVEHRQRNFFTRGSVEAPEIVKPLGLENLTLDDLTDLFKHLMSKAAAAKGRIEGEPWSVRDKIHLIRQHLLSDKTLQLEILFTEDKGRDEVIVTFLAILELMKLGEIRVARETATQKILIFIREKNG